MGIIMFSINITTPQVIARTLFNIYEITQVRRLDIMNSLERDHSDFIANSELHR